jgi:hypothetical protein
MSIIISNQITKKNRSKIHAFVEQINYTQILEKPMPWLTGLAHFAKHSPDGKVIHFRRQCFLNGF